MKAKDSHYESYARQSIIEALVYLMQKDDFEKITILEITQQAQVARRTFYLYYRNKTDVIEDWLKAVFQELDEGRAKENIVTRKDEMLYYSRFWNSHRDVLKTLYDHHLFNMIMDRSMEYTSSNKFWGMEATDSRYYTAFIVWGYWGLLNMWTRGGFKEDPEDLIAYAEQVQSGYDTLGQQAGP